MQAAADGELAPIIEVGQRERRYADSEGSGPAAQQHVPAGFLCACDGYVVGLHDSDQAAGSGPIGRPTSSA